VNREYFVRHLPLKALNVSDAKMLGQFRKLKDDICQIAKIDCIVRLDDHSKGILLRPGIKSVADMSTPGQRLVAETGARMVDHDLEIGYEFWSMEEVLEQILPPELHAEIPTGYTIVGHIAHLNVRDEYLPYKHVIGEIVLDKNPRIRTVVNKTDSIENQFRVFPMEVLAGEPDFLVDQSESGCRFRFDFSKVYWNSRLHTEHDRIISQLRPHEAFCDVFAGVGPFAVPAAKKQVFTLANDLNPESYRYLVENEQLNKVGEFLRCHNLDGREFIRQSPRLLLEWRRIKGAVAVRTKTKPVKTTTVPVPQTIARYSMNLPDSALQFLDAFRGVFRDVPEYAPSNVEMPIIHVYCFYKYPPGEQEPESNRVQGDLTRIVNERLAHIFAPSDIEFRFVRKVAPAKDMYCLTFTLPESVAFEPRK
ncbi:hypothetical protein CANCADRAFT_13050, partial [Tortispora caseinolytica NRRL Y-17796]